jgi:TonB family protein
LIKMPAPAEITRGMAATITTILPELITTPGAGISSTSIDLLLMAYIAVMIVIGTPLLINLLKMIGTMRNADGKYHDDFFVIESNDNRPSWSFFKLIYIGRSGELTPADKELIMKHEMLHGQRYHSIDMLFATLLCIVFWFNPVVWIYRRTLAKVHEFEVDELVAKANGPVDYCMLLAKTALSGSGMLLSHHFNQSFILKRINMINTIKHKISNWKLVVLGLTLTGYVVLTSCTDAVDQNSAMANQLRASAPKDQSGKIYTVVENQPSPLGGTEEINETIAAELKYPSSAAEKKLEGTTYIEFVVRPDGKLTDFKVVKGFDDECDAAALAAVQTLKPWNPGTQNGTAVAVKMVLPIKFRLDD